MTRQGSSSLWTTTSAVFLLGSALGAAAAAAVLSQRTKREELPAPRRYGGAIRLKQDKYRRYRELHDDVWYEVIERMHRSNIWNFTIYYHKQTETLFYHFEWIGHWRNQGAVDEEDLFDNDMKAIANDPVTRKWWVECEPCQEPFSQWKGGKPPSAGGEGDWWAPLQCVCHCGYWPIEYSPKNRDPDFCQLTQN